MTHTYNVFSGMPSPGLRYLFHHHHPRHLSSHRLTVLPGTMSVVKAFLSGMVSYEREEEFSYFRHFINFGWLSKIITGWASQTHTHHKHENAMCVCTVYEHDFDFGCV